jgi:cytochrome c5
MRSKWFWTLIACGVACDAARSNTESPVSGGDTPGVKDTHDPAVDMIEQGRQTFRFDTFGDEDFWSGTLRLNEAVAKLTPRQALAAGLKVDASALPGGPVNLDDPAVTAVLLQRDAVLGVKATFKNGKLCKVGITCALCHSTVDDSVGPGIGHRLDGWANRDLDVGAIIAMAPNLDPVAQSLHVTVDQVRAVLNSWGPGKFDAEMFLDGKTMRPDGKPAAVLIPPAFGLAGIGLHTWTGWGSVTHWNALVANLLMHGKGNFFDPRLDDATKFPIAAEQHLGHIVRDEDEDLITGKLPALHVFQLSLVAPMPPAGSFDADLAEEGDHLFEEKCANCHVQDNAEPGWPMHTGAEIGIDDFQANRAPDGRYRTSPLKGLWTHEKGGFYHDGRFATLADVVDHYNTALGLGLSDHDKAAIVEYLKSI